MVKWFQAFQFNVSKFIYQELLSNSKSLICVPTDKCFQILLLIVCTQLNGLKFCYVLFEHS